jgi:hypothetical protein
MWLRPLLSRNFFVTLSPNVYPTPLPRHPQHQLAVVVVVAIAFICAQQQ